MTALAESSRTVGRVRERAREAALRGASAWSGTVAPRLAPAIAPAAAAVRRTLGVVRPLGWVVLALAAITAVIAVRLGWAELWTVALCLAGCLAVAAAFLVGRTSYSVELDLSRDDVVVGGEAFGEVRAVNPSRRAVLPSRLELPVGVAFAAFDLPRLAPAEAFDALFTIPTERRAVLSVGPVRSIRGDAIGLLSRTVRWTDPVDLFIHPRTVHLGGASTGVLRDLEGLPTADIADDDVSFHALRDYVAGDDLRHVHWKATARTQSLMVRQFEETRRSHLAVLLSTAEADYADADEFELAVSTAGSLGIQALAEGKDVTVVTSTGTLRSTSPKVLLDALSGIDRSGRAADLVASARSTARAVPGASVVALVAGSPSTPSALRAASVYLPAMARAFAIRCAPAERQSRGRIGALDVASIPALDVLAPTMRRLAS